MASPKTIKESSNLYIIREWEKVLVDNGFSLVNSHIRLDLQMEAEYHQVRFDSCCIIAENS